VIETANNDPQGAYGRGPTGTDEIFLKSATEPVRDDGASCPNAKAVNMA